MAFLSLNFLSELSENFNQTQPNCRAQINKTKISGEIKYILSVNLDFSGLDFAINDNKKLELVSERWYRNKSHRLEHSGIEIGDPTIDNLLKIVHLFQQKGRGNDKSEKSICSLLSNRLTIEAYRQILAQKNYKIDEYELKLLTDRLVDLSDFNKDEILAELKDQLNQTQLNYEACTFQENNKTILDVYLGFSGLQFRINKNGKLVLTQESWYASKVSWVENQKVVIGKPSLNNLLKTIDLYVQKGRAVDSTNQGMSDLIQIHKTDLFEN